MSREWTDTHIIEMIKEENSGNWPSMDTLAKEIFQAMLARSYIEGSTYGILTTGGVVAKTVSFSDDNTKQSVLYGGFSIRMEYNTRGNAIATVSIPVYVNNDVNIAKNKYVFAGMQGIVHAGKGSIYDVGTGDIVRLDMRSASTLNVFNDYFGGGDLVHSYPCIPSIKITEFNGCIDTTGGVKMGITQITDEAILNKYADTRFYYDYSSGSVKKVTSVSNITFPMYVLSLDFLKSVEPDISQYGIDYARKLVFKVVKPCQES